MYQLQVLNYAADTTSSSNPLQFTIDSPVMLSSFHPNKGPAYGGTVVQVLGANFVDSPNLICRFGDYTFTPALFITSSQITCQAPEHAVMNVTLEISMNQIDFTSNELLFEYQPAVNVSDVTPSQGSSNGGTVVTIVGSGFPMYTDITCRFDDQTTKASYISDTEITCKSPAASAGFTRVDVSINNQDYSESKSVFEFIDIPKTTGLVPYQGPTNGGTMSLLTGSSFTSPSALKCNYGRRTVTSAQVHSSGEISCVSPSDGPVAVSVGLEGEGDTTFSRGHSTQGFAFQV
jgi:hypothetical protein